MFGQILGEIYITDVVRAIRYEVKGKDKVFGWCSCLFGGCSCGVFSVGVWSGCRWLTCGWKIYLVMANLVQWLIYFTN